MGYAGNSPTANFASVTKDLFSGDGSTVAFTLSKAATTNGVAVFVENVRQEPTIAYAVSGTTLTFTAAPVTSSGNNIYVLHHNAPASTVTHPAAQPLTATSGTFTGDVSLSDNVKLNFGAGPANNRTGGDLQIYHDGSKTIIDEDGTGALELKSNRLYIKQANDELMADFRKDQYVRLYYDNTKRFETTSSGIEVTGDIVFSGSGNGINLGVTSNTDANTLDDYEEGTFTPAAGDYSGTASFTTAYYTKVGRIVHFSFSITGDGTSDSSQVNVTGFPFSCPHENAITLQVNTTEFAGAMINTAEIVYMYELDGTGFTYTMLGSGKVKMTGTYVTT